MSTLTNLYKIRSDKAEKENYKKIQIHSLNQSALALTYQLFLGLQNKKSMTRESHGWLISALNKDLAICILIFVYK